MHVLSVLIILIHLYLYREKMSSNFSILYDYGMVKVVTSMKYKTNLGGYLKL